MQYSCTSGQNVVTATLTVMNEYKYTFLWWSCDREKRYYILYQSTYPYDTFAEAAETAAELSDGIDLPDSHGGPYLHVMMIPADCFKEDKKKKRIIAHLQRFGEMLMNQTNI